MTDLDRLLRQRAKAVIVGDIAAIAIIDGKITALQARLAQAAKRAA